MHNGSLMILCSSVAVSRFHNKEPMLQNFYGHNLLMFLISLCVFPVKTLQPSLMFAGKAKNQKGASLR